jgi:uncharacterized membrane protein
MTLKRVRGFLGSAEELVEDLILVLLSIFVIILAVSALMVFATQPTSDRTAVIAQIIPQLSFLARAEYFAALMLPWVLMIIGLMVARELWMMRKTLHGLHVEVLMRRIQERPAAGRRRK